MKKLCVIILLFFCMTNVQAENLYTDFEKVPCTLFENGELNKFSVERRYQWYQTKKRSKYFLEGQNTKEYPLKDEEDLIWSPYSEWGMNIPLSQIGRQLQNRPVYQYQEYKPIQYIFLNDFKGGSGKLYIPEIKIYDNNAEEVDFEITCSNCSDDFDQYVTNGISKEALSYVNWDSVLKIHLLNKKPLGRTSLHLYLYDTTKETKGFSYTATHEDNIQDAYYGRIDQYYFTNSSIDDITYEFINSNEMKKISPQWDSPKISMDRVEETNDRIVRQLTQYRYRDPQYKYYDIVREYDKEYSEKAHGNYTHKDEEKYKDFYTCQKRDRLQLDHMVEFFLKEDSISVSVKSNPSVIPYKIDKVYYKDVNKNQKKTNERGSCLIEEKEKKNAENKYLSCRQNQTRIFYFLLLLCLILVVERVYKKYRKEK